MKKSGKVFIILKIWPEPKSSAAGKRMMQLIDFFQENYDVVLASTATKTPFSENLEKRNLPFHQISLNSDSFDLLLKEINPTIVVFDRFMTEEQFGWRVSEQLPEAIKILDSEDLHFLRENRRENIQKIENNLIEDSKESELSNISIREISAIYRCDLTLIISEFEYELLKSTYNIPFHLIFYLPILSNGPKTDLPTFNQRNHFLFVGNFLHAPNIDAFEQLQSSIWPKIHKLLPKAEMHVYGAYMPERLFQEKQKTPNFILKNRAEDIDLITSKSRIVLAPLRFGAGIKGKLLEAMENGTPSITTSIGAEGMTINGEWNGEIHDNFDDFALAAVKLYTDSALWQEAQQAGFILLKNQFSNQKWKELDIPLTYLKNNLLTHRNKSITAQLIQQQTLQSSKYLSKWIMEKNKKSI